ncbi:hypothetical protein EDB84DRAFT_1442970 [Lactarius hengduanensis]|nr:hypothetical protein EDB84DRAFT_1442970 [Lactarius hengduanensis]
MYIVSQASSSWLWSRAGDVTERSVGVPCWVGMARDVACPIGAAWWWVGGRGVGYSVGAAVAGCQRAMSGRHAGAGPSGDDSRGWQGPATFRVSGKKRKEKETYLACRVGAAWRVGGGGVLRAMSGRGRMEVASVHEGAAMACNVRGEVEKKKKRKKTYLACRVGAAWQVGGGGMLRAMSGRRIEAGTNGGGERARGGGNGLQCSGPLPAPRAREPLPFVPAPTRRPDMARNTPPPPSRCAAPTRHARPSAQCHSCTRATFIRPCPDPATANPPRRPNTARKTFGRMNMISHSCTRATSIPAPTPRHRQPTAPPQHGTQDLDRQPTTTPPQHGTQRHATADPHATPTRAQHPAIRRLTARRPNMARQDPATSRKTLPTRHAPSTRHARPQPPPTSTPPRHTPTHRHAKTPPPPTRHVAPTRRATPHRPATPLQRGTQGPSHTTDPHATPTRRATRQLTATPRPRLRRPATSPQRGAQHPANLSRPRPHPRLHTSTLQ